MITLESEIAVFILTAAFVFGVFTGTAAATLGFYRNPPETDWEQINRDRKSALAKRKQK